MPQFIVKQLDQENLKMEILENGTDQQLRNTLTNQGGKGINQNGPFETPF
jgi:hypothetical protein